jgi:hypothetical protein
MNQQQLLQLTELARSGKVVFSAAIPQKRPSFPSFPLTENITPAQLQQIADHDPKAFDQWVTMLGDRLA